MIATPAVGRFRGRDKDGIGQFRGIRFARAERFGPPMPLPETSAEIDATEFGPIAPQNPSPLEAMLGAQDRPSSEDCLFLNVFTPACDDAGRAVMVWLHGGSFTAGSGDVPWYDGSRLAGRGDVVVVTINYRLGVFGFVEVDGHPDSGCGGLRDQIAALHWVRAHIVAFGGDPQRVTIFGESAGGMSVGSLLGAPAAAGLFQGAIPQSGSGEMVLRADTAAEVHAGLQAALGGSDDGVLLDSDVATLLAAQRTLDDSLRPDADRLLPFMPHVGGSVLPIAPLEAVRAGSAAGVRLLVGATSEEWNLFHLMTRSQGGLTEKAFRSRVAHMVGARDPDEVVAVYEGHRPGATLDDLWCALGTDQVFRLPATRLAEAQTPHAPTWMYEFAYRSSAFEGAMGAAHAIDVPFVFDNLHKMGVEFLLGRMDGATQALGTATSNAWLAMARQGAPGHEGLPEWPRYLPDRAVMVLDETPRLALDPRRAERLAWG